MGKKISLSCLLLLCFAMHGFGQKHLQSFTPGEIWLDNAGKHINAHGGGILFHKGTYYWYGEHKVAMETGNTAQVGVHVYSSKDLYNWKDQGIALKVDEGNEQCDIARGCILERPKVIYNAKTKKFVMWFHLELKETSYSSALSGVAVSSKPIGPFNYIRSFRPNAGHWPINAKPFHKLPVSPDVRSGYCGGSKCLPNHPDTLNLIGRDFKGGQMARDMTLFVDDDGKAYQIYTSEENSTIQISELSDDFLSCSGRYAYVFTNRYMEAPSIFKKSNKTYFFIGSGCTGWDPNAARLASAPSIWGPWTELGNPCVGDDEDKTFHSQSTFILPIHGKKDAFIFMADRWNPKNAVDGRYVWLPIQFKNDIPWLEWKDEWQITNAF